MGRNAINLDQINARLGESSGSRNAVVYNDDNVSDIEFREVDDLDNGRGGLSNAALVISILGIFLVFGGGTFFSSHILALFS